MLRTRMHAWLLAATAAVTPACLNHYVLHPEKDPLTVSTWDEEVVQGALRIRLEWVRPQGDG